MAKKQELYFDKLDNTANLFPVIVSESVSNVYRISATLKEEIDCEKLQMAVDKVLPYFSVFGAISQALKRAEKAFKKIYNPTV